jgi:hypothetical protein
MQWHVTGRVKVVHISCVLVPLPAWAVHWIACCCSKECQVRYSNLQCDFCKQLWLPLCDYLGTREGLHGQHTTGRYCAVLVLRVRMHGGCLHVSGVQLVPIRHQLPSSGLSFSTRTCWGTAAFQPGWNGEVMKQHSDTVATTHGLVCTTC